MRLFAKIACSSTEMQAGGACNQNYPVSTLQFDLIIVINSLFLKSNYLIFFSFELGDRAAISLLAVLTI